MSFLEGCVIMNNKQLLVDKIKQKSSVVKDVNRTEFRIRCPICGDSQKDPYDTHCYIKCSLDPDEPLQYYCFLCNSHGRVGASFLRALKIDSKTIGEVEGQVIKRLPSLRNTDIDILTGNVNMNSPQVRYIEDRFNIHLTADDYDRFKIIWDWNNIKQYIKNTRILNTLPGNWNTISFMSDDKTLILNRTFLSSEQDHQWRKIRIIPNDGIRAFYTIKSTLDLFTKDKIVVNVAEGIFDILSVYINFSNDCSNNVYIAALGSDYIPALEYMILKGFIGSNIEIRVYIDDGIDEKVLFEKLKSMKWLFGSINVYKNTLYKDVGVDIKHIRLIRKRI